MIPTSSDLELFDVKAAQAFAFRNSLSWLQGRPLIVYTGTFGHINGVGYLVEFAEQLDKINPEIRVLLVGDGVAYEKVESLAKEKSILNKNLYMMKKSV